MTGAYQEILGDIHNLFGDTHTVNVQKTVDKGLLLTEFEAGDCVHELLSSVHIDSRDIVIKIENKLNQMKNNNEVGLNGFNEIKNAFFGYTYLDSMNRPAHRIKN
jgi:arginine decarboxylase